VVLVHGAGVTSDIWQCQIGPYRERYNLVLPDLRGHGGSARRPEEAGREPHSLDNAARDVVARTMARKHASARLHVVEHCGHVCTVERPDAFNRASLEFLAGR